MNKSKYLRLPGLIDIHVHLRDPGQEYKEDFFTGSCAALAGGFTTILDMPNNKFPITSSTLLKEKIKKAQDMTLCDIGFYFGSLGDNIDQFAKVRNDVFGLKIYLNQTTGNYIIDLNKSEYIIKHWPGNSPILLHAEDNIVEKVTTVAKKYKKRIHFCHVSSKTELEAIIQAKEKGIAVTCGVTPHYLFLDKTDVKTLKGFALMKPTLKSKKDQEYLWEHMDMVDMIESDHAPHTVEEKKSDQPPFGVSGLETTLPLLLTAVSEGRLKMNDIITKCFDKPKKIFSIPTDDNTWIEVDPEEKYTINNKDLKTKCGWSPFHGWSVKGRVKKVYIRGKKVYEDSKILVKPGFGKVIIPN